jgi:hypothetical protein
MIDDLVAAYGAFISNALSQNRTGEAATALERAKELEKMKSAGN